MDKSGDCEAAQKVLPHIIALGLAAEIAAERMKEYANLAVLRDGMEARLFGNNPRSEGFWQ